MARPIPLMAPNASEPYREPTYKAASTMSSWIIIEKVIVLVFLDAKDTVFSGNNTLFAKKRDSTNYSN
jgi:hypothetical protein